jgi:hypothetical protein
VVGGREKKGRTGKGAGWMDRVKNYMWGVMGK